MRVALCLYGLTGSVDFGYGLGKPIDPRIAHNHHTKRIIEANENVDVFFHTWSTDFEDMLVDIYKPKGHIAEKQILFSPDSVGKNSIPSRWWSNAMVMQLKQKYEEENGFKYDWVMLYRFDHIFLVNLNFSEFDNQYIYFRHTNGLRAPQQFSHGYPGREECRCYGKKGKYGLRLHDVFTFGNSENMDKFSSVYDETKEFNINNFAMFTDNLTSNPIVQSRFPGWAGIDNFDTAELKERVGFSKDAKI